MSFTDREKEILLNATRGAFRATLTDDTLADVASLYGVESRTAAGDALETAFEWAREERQHDYEHGTPYYVELVIDANERASEAEKKLGRIMEAIRNHKQSVEAFELQTGQIVKRGWDHNLWNWAEAL